MRQALWIGVFVLLAAGSTAPALAANAEFQGNCSNTPGSPLITDCVFDRSRTPSGSSPTSCSPATVTSYLWDYGDGTSSGFLSSASASWVLHRYYGESNWDICLYVLCNDGTWDSTCHCMINYLGIFGCILPGAGWTP